MPLSTKYGVSKVEVRRFVGENEIVGAWLGKFGGRNRVNMARVLCRFFKWLNVVEGVCVSPKELLNEQIVLRNSDNIGSRQKHLHWVLGHTRDNPDFKSYGDGSKYALFLAIKSFYDFHEVPLTTAKGVYGKRGRRKKRRKQITLAQAKKIVGLLPQRERTILLIILQSGMEIGAVLNKMNFMWDSVVGQVEGGRQRVKVELEDRKANGFPYFTYFSVDAVQELKKWLFLRERLVAKFGEPSDRAIFLGRTGKAYTVNGFFQTLNYYRQKRRLPSFTTHQFRKLFKTEASIPERGIDRNVVEFWMGHVSGIDSMGGVYDRTPEIHEDLIEREYEKLEPYVNIYSGGAGRVSEEESARRDAELEVLRAEVARNREALLVLRDPEVQRKLRELSLG